MHSQCCAESHHFWCASFSKPSGSLQGALETSGGYIEPDAGGGDVADLDLGSLSLPTEQVAGVALADSLGGVLVTMVNFEQNGCYKMLMFGPPFVMMPTRLRLTMTLLCLITISL